MRLQLIAAMVVALMAVAISPAFAQDIYPQIDGRVTVEWGNMVADILREQAAGLAASAIAAVMTFMPNGIASIVRMMRIDQLLAKAVVSGINKTAGAVQGKALSASIGNEVVEKALDYAAYNAPKLFKKLPLNEWREKIIGRINMAENVTIDPASQGFVQLGR